VMGGWGVGKRLDGSAWNCQGVPWWGAGKGSRGGAVQGPPPHIPCALAVLVLGRGHVATGPEADRQGHVACDAVWLLRCAA
jgi:hypothetical protein